MLLPLLANRVDQHSDLRLVIHEAALVRCDIRVLVKDDRLRVAQLRYFVLGAVRRGGTIEILLPYGIITLVRAMLDIK